MKPGGQAAPKRNLRWLGPLRDPMERLLSGGPAPTDPLYLTNRTPAQKLKSWGLIAIPCVILAVGVAVTLSNFLDPPEAKRAPEPPPGQITAKVLPNMGKDLKLASPDVQVLEVRVEGSRLVGSVKNITTHEIAVAELVFALTDSAGSQVGDVTGTVEKLPPSSNKEFQIPIKQHDAAFALVREVKSR